MEKFRLNLDSFNGITFKTEANGDQTNQCFLEIDQSQATEMLIELVRHDPHLAITFAKRSIEIDFGFDDQGNETQIEIYRNKPWHIKNAMENNNG